MGLLWVGLGEHTMTCAQECACERCWSLFLTRQTSQWLSRTRSHALGATPKHKGLSGPGPHGICCFRLLRRPGRQLYRLRLVAPRRVDPCGKGGKGSPPAWGCSYFVGNLILAVVKGTRKERDPKCRAPPKNETLIYWSREKYQESKEERYSRSEVQQAPELKALAGLVGDVGAPEISLAGSQAVLIQGLQSETKWITKMTSSSFFGTRVETSIWLSPLERINICPTVIDSLQNQQNKKIQRALKQMEGRLRAKCRSKRKDRV